MRTARLAQSQSRDRNHERKPSLRTSEELCRNMVCMYNAGQSVPHVDPAAAHIEFVRLSERSVKPGHCESAVISFKKNTVDGA